MRPAQNCLQSIYWPINQITKKRQVFEEFMHALRGIHVCSLTWHLLAGASQAQTSYSSSVFHHLTHHTGKRVAFPGHDEISIPGDDGALQIPLATPPQRDPHTLQ